MLMIKWMSNLKIFAKILFLAVVLIAFLAGIGLYAMKTMGELNQSMQSMFNNQLVPITYLANIRYNTMLSSRDVLVHLNSNDPEEMKQTQEKIQQQIAIVNDNIAKYKQTSLSEEEKQLLTQFEASLEKYRPLREEVLRLSQEGKKVEAQAANSKAVTAREKVIQDISGLVEHNQKIAAETYQKGQQAYTTTARNFLFILLAALAAALLFTVFLGRLMSKPIKVLEQAAGKVADGDLRVSWDIKSKDEIGSLAVSLAKMLANLRQIIGNVSESAAQVASAAEELTASAEQNTQAVTEITQSAQELASGADKQNAGVQTTMATIEEVSAAIEQITATSQDVAASAQETSRQAKEGNEAMTRAIGEMGKINDSTRDVSAIINELGSRSQAIGQIVDLISGIADQTNLLALNAAIEAARAGEQGRGFAVVAEEVRKLAEQSSQAAKEIASLIHQIQDDTSKAVHAMDTNTNLVDRGNQVITEGAAAFERIGRAVEAVSRQIQDVSVSTAQIAKGSEDMVNAVKTIGEIAQRVAESAQHTASATEEQSASMEEITSSTDSLAQLAQGLQETVSRFKL